ncbi:solute carrier family 2, facilitated glucose transporter member 10-like [Amphiura filiformis]|uniref:solute carrier family 2, facilitated glucose transporter member 10-like n=1 Tax=Amphiura filiformis TaxID=82378 RepID=UPI003B21A110
MATSSNRFVIDDQHMDTVTLLSDPDDEEDGEDELFNRDDGLTYDMRSSELEQMHVDDGLYSITPPSVTYRVAMTTYVWVAAGMAALGGVLFGYDMGIVSGALLLLKPTFNLSCFEQEMVVSSMLLGALCGSLVGGFIVDWIGRRITIICNAFIFVIGAIILATAHSYAVLVFGRLVVGFAVSLSAIGECIYISEISPVKRRGQLVSLNEFGITLGLLMAYLVNYIFISTPHGWRYMFGLAAIPAGIQGIGMIFLPPSPRFLVQKGRDNQAHAVLQRLRGTSNVEGELNNIRSSLMSEQVYSVFDLLRSADNMRGRMMIGVGLVFFQQFTGQVSVLYYAPSVFQALGFESNTSATLATVGLGIVKVLATIGSLLSVDRVGRRSLLLLGATCMMLVTFALGMVTLMIHPVTTDPCSNIRLQEPIPTALNVTDVVIISKAHVQDTFHKSLQSIQEPYRHLRIVDEKRNRLRRNLDVLQDFVHSSASDAITERHENNAMNSVIRELPVQFLNLDLDKRNSSSISNLLYLLESESFYKSIDDYKDRFLNNIVLKQIQNQIYSNSIYIDMIKRSKRSLLKHNVANSQHDALEREETMQLDSEAGLARNDADAILLSRRAAGDVTIDTPTTEQNNNIGSVNTKSVPNSAVSETDSAGKQKGNKLNVLETTTEGKLSEGDKMMTTSEPKRSTTEEGNKVATDIDMTIASTRVTAKDTEKLPDMLQKETSRAVKAVALIALMCYIAAFAIGFGPVTWLILSEIFPAGVRGRAVSFASVFNWSTNILVSATFLDVLSSIGTSWTFLTYSAICGVSILFVFLLIPETKNKSLEQISVDLKKGSTLGRAFARCRHRTSCTLLCCCQLSISHSRLPVSESQSDFISSTNQVTVSNTRL